MPEFGKTHESAGDAVVYVERPGDDYDAMLADRAAARKVAENILGKEAAKQVEAGVYYPLVNNATNEGTVETSVSEDGAPQGKTGLYEGLGSDDPARTRRSQHSSLYTPRRTKHRRAR